MVDYVKFSPATGGRFSLTPTLRVVPANMAISDIPLKTRFFRLHFTRRMYPCIFNHFYVIGRKIYRVQRNNANYMAITHFKVIQGHRFWYEWKAHVIIIIIINKVLIKVTLNKVIAGALYIVICG